jgi:hypothetical protein
MRIRTASGLVIVLLGGAVVMRSQSIPKELWGTWRISRELSTKTISCWGEGDAKTIIGTRIEYSDKIFRWNGKVTVNNPVTKTRIVTADQFQRENSSPSSNGSYVDFRQLGIAAKEATEVSIQHEPANISGATVEVPGDEVLLKDENTIVFSVCSLYFEANRVHDKK